MFIPEVEYTLETPKMVVPRISRDGIKLSRYSGAISIVEGGIREFGASIGLIDFDAKYIDGTIVLSGTKLAFTGDKRVNWREEIESGSLTENWESERKQKALGFLSVPLHVMYEERRKGGLISAAKQENGALPGKT